MPLSGVINDVATGGLVLVGSLLIAISLYDLLILLAGVHRPSVKGGAARPRRFAVLIAAHDERKVIARAVESLLAQTYPSDCFDVFVIADRCSDSTAACASDAGAIVYERQSGRGGKPAALRYLVDQIAARGDSYDAVCVFDADNLVAPGFLRIMNRYLEAGARFVQGYLDVKNPDDSWVTGSIAIGYWTTNRLWQAARERLGLCCALGGTGFCLSWDLARELAWKTDCLTEDVELQMELVQRGERVHWAHDAHIYDEKPVSLRASWRQRVRWMRGHYDVAQRYFVPLIRRALSRGDLVAFDAAIYALQPLRTLVAAVALLGIGIAICFGWSAPPFSALFGAVLVAYLSYLSHFCFFGIPALGLALEGIPVRYWRFYPAAFVFGLTWIPVCLWGLLTARRTEWSHTLHPRGLSLRDCRRFLDLSPFNAPRTGVATTLRHQRREES